MRRFGILIAIFAVLQILSAASIEDKYEPMVAFNCDNPAVHRGVNGWVADKSTTCLDKMEDILAYCKKIYPDHNITNVVEASYLVTIPNWPSGSSDHQHPHRVRPFRCLVGGFQSDALLVPQHCEFDHRHDQSRCEGFSYWSTVADEACRKKEMHLESFGMLLNCKLGKFSGVEYVCCPNETESKYHPPQDDKPDNWKSSSEKDDDEDDDKSSTEEDDSDDDDDDDDDNDDNDDSSDNEDDENTADLYEAYLRGQEFPHKYNNEHKKFLAAKERMKKNQQHKVTKLLQEWQAARDHVSEVRKTDTKTADGMAKEITERFQNLYAAYEQEDEAEKDQLVALHLQHVQASLNEKKRDAMDSYMKSLEKGDVPKIIKYLRAYIKAEEKDRLHTVNHYEHLKYSAPHEAARIRPAIVNHLRSSEQRIDQAMEMLTHYPDIDAKIRRSTQEFLKRFDAIAKSIGDIILPEPKVDQQAETTSQAADISKIIMDQNSNNNNNDNNNINNNNNNNNDVSMDSSVSEEIDTIGHDVDEDDDDDIHEDEHDYERKNTFVAHRMQDTHHVQQGFAESTASKSQIGSTVGIALGSVSVFVIIVVAIIMLRRNKSRQSVSHGYVEVDPSASPEERHLANMQMNGYENPTYKYFEVQNNPKA